MSRVAAFWTKVGTRFLPFADAASTDLPLGRLLRLSLFQISCGMTTVLLMGTLNRVMIVEMGLPAGLVALMVALPLMFAPFRALMGHRSDTHRSALGWKRVPFLWFGTLMQFGGLAIMPFALLLMTAAPGASALAGQGAAALAFLLVGAGLHTTQTAGLALATDLAPADRRPRVVAMLYVMLLVGMLVSALFFGQLLMDFSPTRLVGVVQGAALATIILNIVALWKQEARRPQRPDRQSPRVPFSAMWRPFIADRATRRLLFATGLGAAGFAMQDVLLEPYGAEVLGMTVAATTRLTALWAAGTLAALALASRLLRQGRDPLQVAAIGGLSGVFAFAALVVSDPMALPPLLALGVAGIGFGGGLFGVGTLSAAMALGRAPDGADRPSGLALGAWGAVQATAAGAAMILSGLVRDGMHLAADSGALSGGLAERAMPYTIVWHIEIGLLFLALAALGPLVRHTQSSPNGTARPFGLAEFPA